MFCHEVNSQVSDVLSWCEHCSCMGCKASLFSLDVTMCCKIFSRVLVINDFYTLALGPAVFLSCMIATS